MIIITTTTKKEWMKEKRIDLMFTESIINTLYNDNAHSLQENYTSVRILIKSSLLVECGSLLWPFLQRLVELLLRLPSFKGTAFALQTVKPRKMAVPCPVVDIGRISSFLNYVLNVIHWHSIEVRFIFYYSVTCISLNLVLKNLSVSITLHEWNIFTMYFQA